MQKRDDIPRRNYIRAVVDCVKNYDEWPSPEKDRIEFDICPHLAGEVLVTIERADFEMVANLKRDDKDAGDEWDKAKVENLRANTQLKQAQALSLVRGRPKTVINLNVTVSGNANVDEVAGKIVEQLNAIPRSSS